MAPGSPSRFWQMWAIAGMIILTAAFWWGTQAATLPGTAAARGMSAVIDGLWRFSLLVLTPALVLVWLGAGWLRRRVGDRGYWNLLALIAMIWAAAVLIVRLAA